MPRLFRKPTKSHNMSLKNRTSQSGQGETVGREGRTDRPPLGPGRGLQHREAAASKPRQTVKRQATESKIAEQTQNM